MSTLAARKGDRHRCPLFDGQTPHLGGVITSGASSVLIEEKLAAVAGAPCRCTGSASLNSISGGSSSVLIEGKPASRLGDATGHGGLIIESSATVLIGA
jgi:uncharacterized Zn-binding protein involved in type VI secretion